MQQAGVEYQYNNSGSAIRDEINSTVQGALLYGSAEKSNVPDNNVAIFFDVIKSHEIQINDNITDNWLENSTVVNDCISQSPIIVNLSGVSGEVVYIPFDFKGFLKDFWQNHNNLNSIIEYEKISGLNSKLNVISSLYPPIDNVTQLAKNAVDIVAANVERYKKIYNQLTQKEKNNQTRLQKIYEDLTVLRSYSKQTGEGLIIETPYTVFKNMFFQSISLKQDERLYITDIEVTLKQCNFSEVETTKADKNVLSELNAQARAEIENQGKVQGKSTEFKSILKGGTGIFGKVLGF